MPVMDGGTSAKDCNVVAIVGFTRSVRRSVEVLVLGLLLTACTGPRADTTVEASPSTTVPSIVSATTGQSTIEDRRPDGTIRTTPERWTHANVTDAGHLGGGRLVLADAHRVYVADGFGDFSHVVALSTETGETLWRRDDLTRDRDDWFLQTVAGETLIVNSQYHWPLGLDARSGETVWTFMLPDGYGVASSTLVGPRLVAVAGAEREGDVRPPLAVALSVADGTLLWETPLADGMDPNWAAPVAAGGVVAIASTESHPGSSDSGNMVHLLDVDSGEIKWVNHLGGSQGFHVYPSFIINQRVIVWWSGNIAALDTTTGDRIWRTGGQTLALGNDGKIYAERDGVIKVDHLTGETSKLIDSESLDGFEIIGAAITGTEVIAFGTDGLRGIDPATGELLWSIDHERAADLPSVTGGFVVVPTQDRAVTLFDLP